MARSVMSWMYLAVVIVAVGCTKSPPSPAKPTPGKDMGPKESTAAESQAGAPAPSMDTKLAAPVDTKPATDVAVESAPGGATQPDMKPPADVTPPAPKLPFEDLVAALASEQANAAYRKVEEQLAQNPTDIMMRMQRLYLLNQVGSALSATGKKETGLEAFRAALEQAQSLVAEPGQKFPDEIREALGEVFYKGACAQSLDGKPEDAKKSVQQAIELGFSQMQLLRDDPDLAAVRALPDFDQQLAAWEKLIVDLVLSSGETFPFDFALTDISGQNISLADYQGKVLIVDIWGTWCGPCKMEIPLFIKLQTEYGPQGFQMVGLNYEQEKDEAANKDVVTKYVQENGINYPCALGTEEIRQQVPDFQGFPTTLFIDRAGKVCVKVVGTHEYGFLEAIVKILLAEPAPPPAAATDATPAAPGAAAPPAAPSDAPPVDTPPAGEGPSPTDAPAAPGK